MKAKNLFNSKIINKIEINKFIDETNEDNWPPNGNDNVKANVILEFKGIIWGVLSNIYEDWTEVDLGLQNGIMIFDKIIWYKTINIIKLLSNDSLIKTIRHRRLRKETIVLLSLNKTNPCNENKIVFGIIIEINITYLNMYISGKIKLPVLCSTFETKDLKLYC